MEFDFIVIGGGSAGCVLGARLSENPDYSVLLIEAGGQDCHPLYHLPAGFARMTKGIGSWGWQTTPQRHMQGKVFRFTQAKVMGGGSTINAQIYTRGASHDYNEWRDAGCIGWGYDDVLPYFKKAEDNDSFENDFHAKGGPLGVSQPIAPLPICEAFFDAAGRLGIPRNFDVNGEQQDGVGFYQLTQRNARRCSAATAYLRPAQARKNLHIMAKRQVKRITLHQNRAVGIVLENGEAITARCEVILSCGAVGTPRLLQLSGIGAAKHLGRLGIETICENPHVGQHFQDHLDLYTIAELQGPYSYDKYIKWHHALAAMLRYVLTKSGPVASSLFETGGFCYADPAARSPDLQLHLGLGTGIEHGVESMPNGGITLNSCYLRPYSRGSVMLASPALQDAPLIDPNYLADSRDREMSLTGLKLTQKILAATPLTDFIREEKLPGPKIRTNDEYFNYICQHAKTSHHAAGTARMGSGGDSVVDLRLRLRGVDALRVVDNSIMPRLISSNTNAAAMMIAEKAADMIKQDSR